MSFKYGDNGAHFQSLSRQMFIVAHKKRRNTEIVLSRIKKDSLRRINPGLYLSHLHPAEQSYTA